MIQRFKYPFKWGWETLRDKMAEGRPQRNKKSSKAVVKHAFQAKYL